MNFLNFGKLLVGVVSSTSLSNSFTRYRRIVTGSTGRQCAKAGAVIASGEVLLSSKLGDLAELFTIQPSGERAGYHLSLTSCQSFGLPLLVDYQAG